MWLTIVNIVLLLIGVVGYAYFLYVEIRNDKLPQEEKKVREKTYITEIFLGLMVVSVMHLTEKWLSPYITSEAAMFFSQILILIILTIAIVMPVRRIANR
jgi:uncharacterized membrane protein